MQEGKVCCFSGHRILRHSEQAIRAALDRQVAHMAQNGYTCFISGAASGFDLLAAEAVVPSVVAEAAVAFVKFYIFKTQFAYFVNCVFYISWF